MVKLTPLMEQYHKIKSHYKDKILFFRMGDFFEMFDKDAEIAAPILNIALTYRNKKAGLKTKMCGLPHHSIASPIAKLLSQGLHVAICDQVEPASQAKGSVVKRAVTRVLSPGMVYDLKTLDQSQANYMSAFDTQHISFLDLSTGVAFYYQSSVSVFKLIEQYQPKELVLTSHQKDKYCKNLLPYSNIFTVFNKNSFKNQSFLPKEFKKYQSAPESAKRLISYVYQTQGLESLKILRPFKQKNLKQEMYYSRHLYSHLEVFKNYEGSSKDSLFSAINRAKTPNGARLLKRHLKSPLTNVTQIEQRLDQIDWWRARPELLELTRLKLAKMGDGERKLGKIVQSNCNGQDLIALTFWLDCGLQIEHSLKDKAFKHSYPVKELQKASDIKDKIGRIISPLSPIDLKQGGMINKGVNPQLDDWIDLAKNSQTQLLDMEQKEQKKLRIPSLKIRYNSVFGYYIEIRKTHNSKVPHYYKRQQTLVNAERYTTKELHLLEKRILSARFKKIELERKIFQDLRLEILELLPFLNQLCDYFSRIDLYSSLAFTAIENKYTRPCFGKTFKLKASRHPVLEQKSFHEFVPNTLDLPCPQTVVLTGPNMAGKSTLMRQLALTVLLAQSGCFVPAEEAELPLFDKIFTRIGASDFLSRGLSTFMVEMQETAEILQQADHKSLIILDEIGRGTATFDGMSLAQAILEFLTREKKPVLFLATHYQELTQLAGDMPGVCNASMAIREDKEDIHFLYLLKKGPASKSYGLQVAKQAGFPQEALKRAQQLLDKKELSQPNNLSRESGNPHLPTSSESSSQNPNSKLASLNGGSESNHRQIKKHGGSESNHRQIKKHGSSESNHQNPKISEQKTHTSKEEQQTFLALYDKSAHCDDSTSQEKGTKPATHLSQTHIQQLKHMQHNQQVMQHSQQVMQHSQQVMQHNSQQQPKQQALANKKLL